MTLGEMARWWTYRQAAAIDATGTIRAGTGENKDGIGDLDLELVTGYSSEGFKVERLDDTGVIELPRGSGR